MLALLEPNDRYEASIALKTTKDSEPGFLRRKTDMLIEITRLREKLLLTEMQNDEQTVVINQLNRLIKTNLEGSKDNDNKLKIYRSKLIQYKTAFQKLQQRTKKAITAAKRSQQRVSSQNANSRLQREQIKILEEILSELVQLEVKRSSESNNLNGKPRKHVSTIGKLTSFQSSDLLNKVTNFSSNGLKKLNLSKLKATKGKFSTKFGQLLAKFKKPQEQQNSLVQPQWVKVIDCLPIRSGLYYISNGSHSDIALFNQSTQEFSKTNNEVTADVWCFNLGEQTPNLDL